MDGLVFTCMVYAISLPMVGWTCGALFYDVGRASALGAVLAAVWLVLALSALALWHPLWQPFLLLLLLFGCFLCWWLSQHPSNDRDWAPGFTQVARVGLEGDLLTVENVRDVEYRTLEDCTIQYETRTYQLSELQGVDALILYWGSAWMCHPMLVFDFGTDGRLCISIEVRYRAGQDYNFLRSLYRQQELMYVVSDERDAILRRTKYLTAIDLYLYRVQLDGLHLRSLFFEYANSINKLAQRPRWYHGLTTNCTTSIYAQGRGRMDWDWRMLFNGSLDRAMYDRQLLDQSFTFQELKAQSRVNDIANRAPVDGWGDHVRQALPGYHVPADCENQEFETSEEGQQ